MDLNFTVEEEQFRNEVRAFLKRTLPEKMAASVRRGDAVDKEQQEAWHAILNARGWLAATWPKAFGGTGWSAVERYIFEEECARAYAPRVLPFGLNMLGPVLIRFGSSAQQVALLPRILNGSDWWCQGYSEPGAGSDLASLKTRAQREGDHYIVNGQKTWTTLAQHANKIFCLVRTNSQNKPQAGISFLLIDLDTPGIDVRPIRLLDGSYEVNEVFFNNVRVPADNLVGEESQGWSIAKYLLIHERTNIAGIGFAQRDLEKLKAFSQQTKRGGHSHADSSLFAAKVAEVEIDLEAIRITNLRLLSAARDGVADAVKSSMLKIKSTQIRQQISALYRQIAGPEAAIVSGGNELAVDAAENYFNQRKLSIYGGSNEIQRNIIARHLFGA